MMQLPALYERLTWATGFKTQEAIASELGVTRATVTRYISGVRDIPLERYEQLERMYERTVYVEMRERGLSPEAASKYRSLTPDTVDLWATRLEDAIQYNALGTASSYARRVGLNWEDIPEDIQEEWLKVAEEHQREGLEYSGDDIEEYSESP